MLSVDLVVLMVGGLNVQYERAYSPHLSFFVNPRLYFSDIEYYSGRNYYAVLDIILGIRRYFYLAPKGPYLVMAGGLSVFMGEGWSCVEEA